MKVRKMADGRYLICEANSFAITIKVIEKVSEKAGFTLRISIVENVDTVTISNLNRALLECLKQSNNPDFYGVKRFSFTLDGVEHIIDPTLHRED